ncbi:MAG: hypothetical protein OKBPIBMD_01826 [Chlorobi bacterium]|nr:MAG: hypothetical protein F9K28_09735 [Bacteroidota bacterium]MBV6464359.1 hypothetical protein [Chlorobiota bacterium]MBW7854535.1 hypothetical protein [Candidatus Kapabacteria bacterium]MCC6331932.1 hypothetical protein [Ignavibacteria bacterium]MBZ0194006.1 hypothetical protein [Candidatus Kapabacteria bacterium]
MIRKFFSIAFLLLFAALIFPSCSSDSPTKPDDGKDKNTESRKPLDYEFTIPEGNNTWKFVSNEKEYTGNVTTMSTENNDKFVPILFDGTYPIGGIPWLPQAAGTYITGDSLGQGKGSSTGYFYFTSSVTLDGVQYYAFSTNPYGDQELFRIKDTHGKVTITKFDGKFTTYRMGTVTQTSFIGKIDGLFEGTFKSFDKTQTVTVTRGEFRVALELPKGAEVIK